MISRRERWTLTCAPSLLYSRSMRKRIYRPLHVLVVHKKSSSRAHHRALMDVTRRLQQLKAVFHVLSRDRLRPITGYDIVLTIGGDGTFLDTAHYLKAGLMLGINSMPKQSVGFFCRATTETFSEKI